MNKPGTTGAVLAIPLALAACSYEGGPSSPAPSAPAAHVRFMPHGADARVDAFCGIPPHGKEATLRRAASYLLPKPTTPGETVSVTFGVTADPTDPGSGPEDPAPLLGGVTIYAGDGEFTAIGSDRSTSKSSYRTPIAESFMIGQTVVWFTITQHRTSEASGPSSLASLATLSCDVPSIPGELIGPTS